MAPPTRPKTKAQNLERVRQNQQRSRERKRVYIALLEQKITQLTAQIESGPTAVTLGDEECSVWASDRLQGENDARRDLLLNLGVTAPAQELYIQNFTKRLTRSDTACPRRGQSSSADFAMDFRLAHLRGPHVPSSPAELYPSVNGERLLSSSDYLAEPRRLSPSTQHNRPTYPPPNVLSVSLPLESHLDKASTVRPSVRLLSDQSSSAGIDAATASIGLFPDMLKKAAVSSLQVANEYTSADACNLTSEATASLYPLTGLEAAWSLPRHETLSKGLRFSIPQTSYSTLGESLCSRDNGLQIDGYTSDGTTACTIAMSVITQNNAKGYSTTELELRLLPGYLMTQSDNEDCRIRNRVLFAVLAEIS